jgi:hypothetical protein
VSSDRSWGRQIQGSFRALLVTWHCTEEISADRGLVLQMLSVNGSY